MRTAHNIMKKSGSYYAVLEMLDPARGYVKDNVTIVSAAAVGFREAAGAESFRDPKVLAFANTIVARLPLFAIRLLPEDVPALELPKADATGLVRWLRAFNEKELMDGDPLRNIRTMTETLRGPKFSPEQNAPTT
jgi:hypothetical protein